MIIKHKGKEYDIPSDIQALKELAESSNPNGRTPDKYCPPTGRLFQERDIQNFMLQFPNAFDRNKKKISNFIKDVLDQIKELCVLDKEGFLLSDELGVLIVGKYKHKRKYLINRRTGEVFKPLINGDYLLKVYWLKPDIKEFRPLHLYKFAKTYELIRKASKLFHNGEMDYDVIADKQKLTKDLMQISIMKQKYNAPFK